MSVIFNAREVAEKALRKIGAFSINDTAADAAEMAEALDWLDLMMAEIAGVEECWWLVEDTLSVALAGGTQSYDLIATLGTNAPENGIQFPKYAFLQDSSGNRTKLDIVRRAEFETITDPDQSGRPQCVHIDRASSPVMRTWPTLASGITGYSVELVVQTFAPDIADSKSGNVQHLLHAAWQRWAILQLACDVGGGPVRRLPTGEINDIRRDAELARARLLAIENREHANAPVQVAYRDF